MHQRVIESSILLNVLDQQKMYQTVAIFCSMPFLRRFLSIEQARSQVWICWGGNFPGESGPFACFLGESGIFCTCFGKSGPFYALFGEGGLFRVFNAYWYHVPWENLEKYD